MKFAYIPCETRSPDTDEQNFILRPIIPILIHGDGDAALCSALVDSGADNSFVPLSIAEALGIGLQPCEGPSPLAFDGGRIDTSYADVILRLSDGNENAAWTARVLVFEPQSPDDQVIILGHHGFLSFFTATFDGGAGILTLIPNDTLREID